MSGEKKSEKVPITINLLGNRHIFYIRLENPEDKEKIQAITKIISDIESYVESNFRSLTRDRKLAVLIFYLAWQVLREREKVMTMQEKMRNLEILMEFMEKSEQKR